MTVRSLDWHAAAFPADGGLSGEGAVKVLGRPEKLDPLGVLVRETIQNSWDAAIERHKTPVGYTLRGWTLDAGQRRAFRRVLFANRPPSGLPLGKVLSGRELTALCIEDSGTVGLGGPVRMDRAPDAGQPTDYVDFVFAVGAPQDRSGGGGTYGFGKTIAYLVSEARTIIIYTRTATGESRFIAAGIGNQFAHEGLRYTGRHWWGSKIDPEVIEPIMGEEADHLADITGVGAFPTGSSGTRILIVSPVFGTRSPREAMNYMAQAALWYAWPLMSPRHGLAPLGCEFSWEGRKVVLPEPSQHPHLKLYHRALDAVRAAERGSGDRPPGTEVHDVEILRPRASLGRVGVATGNHEPLPVTSEGKDDDGRVSSAVPYGQHSHHVALMRGVELVVDYLEGPPIEGGAWHWAGVFKASDEAEPAFAESEPPTHDAWNPSMVMDSTRRRYVNVGLRRIKEIVKEKFLVTPRPSGATASSAAAIADRLAHLLLGVPGPRPTPVQRRGGSGGSTTRSPRTSTLRMGDRRLRESDGRVIREFDFVISRPHGEEVTVVADVGVRVAGGGRETEPPIRGGAVEPLGFRQKGARGRPRQGPELQLSEDDGGDWTYLVAGPPDVAVMVDLRLTEGDGS